MSISQKESIPFYYHLTAFLFILGISLWYLFPVLQHIDNSFVSAASNGDAVQYIWNAWELKHNLNTGSNPFLSHDMLQPENANLLMHTYTPLMSIFCLPFNNLYVGINLFLILNFILSALGAYWLCFRLTRRILPSVLTAVFFAFSPYKLIHFAEHYHLMMTAVIPFYIILFLHTFTFTYGKLFPSIRNKKSLLLVFLLGFIAALGDFYTAFFLIYFSVIWALYYKFQPYWQQLSILKRWISVIVLFTLAHIAGHLCYIKGVEDRGGIWWGGDLLGYFIPNNNTWLWDRSWFGHLASLTEKISGNPEYQLFIGYSMCFLAFYILYYSIRKKMPANVASLAFVLLIFFMITLPVLRVAGTKILYLPTSLLHFIPFLNNLRCPTRILVMITLLLPVVAGLLWYNTVSDKKNLLLKNTGMCFLIGLCVLELKTKPFSFLSVDQVPQIIYTVKTSAAKTILPVPLGVRDGMNEAGHTNTNLLYYQTIHEKPMMGGYLSRIPKSTFEVYESDSVCARLLRCSKDSSYVPPVATAEEKQKFFSAFSPDGFLILPEYKNGNAEKYIMSLVKGKRYTRVETDGVFIQLQ